MVINLNDPESNSNFFPFPQGDAWVM